MGDGMLSLYWNNHRATFCHILATLREKERYTDATIACDGKFYPVHKLVLSTCSEYFEKMFEHTPCKHPVIVLKDIKADALEALLNYMYAGYVNVAQNDLARLIKAAETLSIKGLAVPDEPPLGEESKPNQTKTSREDRLSPQPKRRRRDENGSSQPSNSPPSSPRVSSPFPVDSEHSHPRSRTHSESHRTDRIDSLDQPLDHPPLETQSSDVKVPVVVDESLVKEEMVDSVDNNPSEDMESGLHYGSVGGEDGLDSGGGGEDHSGHMLPNKYDQPVIPGQGQPLADAVAEALAGPSGMQGWLGGSELGGGGGYSAESYGGDASQEGPPHPNAPGPPHAQQRVRLNSEGSSCWESRGSGMVKGPSTRKKHQCSFCNYSTTVTTNLKNHLRTHTGERPFQCSYCSFCTTQKGSLRIHIRKHTGEKPYACAFCPYRSATRGNLTAHMTIHKPNLPEGLKIEPDLPDAYLEMQMHHMHIPERFKMEPDLPDDLNL